MPNNQTEQPDGMAIPSPRTDQRTLSFDALLPVADEQSSSLLTVLSLIGSGAASTSRDVGRLSGLGRTATKQRINQLKRTGLVEEAGLGASTGGRAPRRLRFRAEAGHILVAHLETSSISVGVTDLAGRILVQDEEAADVTARADRVLARIEKLFDRVRRKVARGPVWGVAVGVPGAVEFATGRLIVSPLLPAWGDFLMHRHLARHFDAPAWIDQNVNLMALGELTVGPSLSPIDAIFVKIGAGVGSALISAGKLHRGAEGAAGEFGHLAIVKDGKLVCSCGKAECRQSFAGSDAVVWQANEAARAGQSSFLAQRLHQSGALNLDDVIDGAVAGDPTVVGIVARCGERSGETLARLVNFFNPSRVVVGGSLARAGDAFLAAIRQAVYRESLPAATRNLSITSSSLGSLAGLRGAATLATGELFSLKTFAAWFRDRSPAGHSALGQPLSDQTFPQTNLSAGAR